MNTFGTVIEQNLRSLTGVIGDVPVSDAAGVIADLPADAVVAVIESTTAAMSVLEGLRTIAAGAAARLSRQDAGHAGLAQTRGHRSAVALIQDLTGVSRSQAGKVTRLGQELLNTSLPHGDAVSAAGERSDPGDAQVPGLGPNDPSATVRAWHACLSDAFTARLITVDQQAAIRRGLGEPPEPGGADDAPDDPADTARQAAQARVAWAAAAEQLVGEASRRTVEDLGAAARSIRDHLDPDGAARRFQERFERRSFRMWTDRDGLRHGSFVFEDAGAARFTAILDAALRPRRGGPRFVDPAEKTAADALIADPRSNEQLAYDLFLDVLHTGALADAATVFGTRQAGVRVIVSQTARDASQRGRAAVAVIEDTNQTVPAAFAAQHACDTGTIDCTVGTDGNPLDLGREVRLFSARQRLALGLRDGGCAWTGCDRPPSYCEAHHIDKYSEGGRTDVDRGILLCRFHHMNLHHHGWRISRDGTGPFVLHRPGSTAPPIVLQPRLERRYAFGDLRPPPTRFRPAA